MTRPGKILKDNRTGRKQRNIKIQTTSTVKSLKSRKTSTKLITSEPKITRSNTHNIKPQKAENLPTARRKKSVESAISPASMKAKSQLRSNDGKFARNPIKLDANLSDIQPISSTSSSQSTQATRSNSNRFPTRTRQRENSSIGLSKRGTRVSSDVDTMPTLEPADKLTTRQVDSGKSSELPILSPVAKVPSKLPNSTFTAKRTNVGQVAGAKRRGRKSAADKIAKLQQNIGEIGRAHV